MRKAFAAVLLLFVPLWCVGQDAPAGPPPDAQTAPSQNGQPGGHRRPGLVGTITAINGDTLTVKTMNGQSAQVNVNESTRFRKERQPATLADFKVGDEVFVRGQSTGENTWQAEVVAAGSPGGFGRMREGMGKEFIAGEVKAIDGTQLTILRPDGVTQNINVDESTSFRKQGESITLADVKVGDHVFGRGAMKDNVFVPSMLNVGMPMMGRGHGRGQGAGQGGGQGQGEGAPDSQ